MTPGGRGTWSAAHSEGLISWGNSETCLGNEGLRGSELRFAIDSLSRLPDAALLPVCE